MSKYANQTANAFKTLLKKGQLMTLIELTLGTFDPLAPAASTPTIQRQCSAAGVVLPVGTSATRIFRSADIEFLADPNVARNIRYVILSGFGLTFEPQPEHLLQTAEGLYRIKGLSPLNPAGDGAVIYEAGCTLDDTQISIP